MLRRINEALPGLVAGILIWGAVIQLAGVWFVSDKLRYSTGLWFGVAVAVGWAIHMAIEIYDVMAYEDSRQLRRRVTLKSTVRYAVVVVLFFAFRYFRLGNLVTAFLGVMGLKVSAYLQPLVNTKFHKLSGSTDDASCEEEQEQLNKEVTL